MTASEAITQKLVRLEAARLGVMLWRNNSGACYDDVGRLIRYGLGNDSEQLNRRIKSSDLIGVAPRIVTADMIGSVVGVFVAVECKPEAWRGTTLNEREQAQKEFHRVVAEHGGLSGFATNTNDLRRILKI